MTVAPWAQAPGSSIGSALAQVAASKSAMAHSRAPPVHCRWHFCAGGRCAAACTFVRDVLAAEECSAVAGTLESDSSAMQILAAAGRSIVDRLCALGSNPAARHPPTEPARPLVRRSPRALTRKSKKRWPRRSREPSCHLRASPAARRSPPQSCQHLSPRSTIASRSKRRSWGFGYMLSMGASSLRPSA